MNAVPDYCELLKNTATYLLKTTFLCVLIQGCQKQTRIINGCAIQPNTVCQNANLDFQNLEGANLKGADLSGATMWGTNLKGANLSEATLENVTIDNALTNKGKIEANLYKANFKNSNIYRSRINGLGIEKANFKNAVMCHVELGSSSNTENSGCKW